MSSRTKRTSTPSTRSSLRGDAPASAGCTRTGRRFAKSPSARRRPRSPCSGRTSARGSSHFGPPTAPRSTASALSHAASVEGGSGLPVASIAAPPMSVLRERERHDRTAPPRARARAGPGRPPRARSRHPPGGRCSPSSHAAPFTDALEAAASRVITRPYSIPSASAVHDASSTLDDAPTVVHRASPRALSIVTRTVAAVPATPVEDADLVVLEADARRPPGKPPPAPCEAPRRAHSRGRSPRQPCAPPDHGRGS